MKKKSKREVGKMVDAKVKGKQTKHRSETDDSRPESAEVDARISKLGVKQGY